jgi:DNA modification methylase
MKPYHKNPRQINRKQFDQLKENLAYLGDLSGIVHDLNSNEIIGGNQRSNVFDVNKCEIEIVHKYDYPDEQGTVAHGFIIWQGKRYTYRQVDWTPKQCEQANITANRLGGEWDFDELANWDMSDLLTWGFEESDFPFDVAPAMNEGADAEPQIDKAEELRQKWDVQSGQMWQLGEHRIIVGDCTDRAVVERVMSGEKADLVFTDPPYGVDYSGGVGSYAGGSIKSKTRDTIKNDSDCSLYGVTFDLIDKIMNFGSAYVWYADKYTKQVIDKLPDSLELRRIINWYKINQGFGDMGSDYHCVTEPCLYIVKNKSLFCGANNEKNVWELQRSQNNDLHPTQKPLFLAEKAIGNHTASVIVDFFSGSGTTLIACENLSRKCRAVEISPAYVAVAIQRWVDVTGKEPILLDA